MTTTARSSVSPASAAEPVSARRPPAKIRLLLVNGGALPKGIDVALSTLPFGCVSVDAALSGVELRRSDVVIIPKIEVLAAFIIALERRLKGDVSAAKPSVLVIARAPEKPRKLSDKIDVSWVEPSDEVAVLAKRVISRAGELLITKGIARRKSSKPNSAPPAVVARLNPPESKVTQTNVAISLLPSSSSQPIAPHVLAHRPVESHSVERLVVSPAQRAVSNAVRPALRPAPAERVKTRPGEIVRKSPTIKRGPTASDAAPNSAPPPLPVSRAVMTKALHIAGSRWLLLDDDVACVHAVANALETAGATVLLSGTHPDESRIGLFRKFDAAGVMIDESSIDALGPLLQRFQQDPWLRHVRLVPIRWQQLFDFETQRIDQEALKLRLLPLWQPEHDWFVALMLGQSVSLTQLCPAKLLHAAARGEFSGELTLENGDTNYRLTIAAGRLYSLHLNGDERLQTVTEEMAALLALEQGSAKLIEAAQEQKPAGSGVALDTLQPTESVPQVIVQVLASPPPPPPSPPSRRRDELASLLIATWRQCTARLVNSKRVALRFWSTTGRLNRRYLVAILAAIGIVALLTLASQIAKGSAPNAVTTPPVPNSPQRSHANEPAPQVAATAKSTDSGYPPGCERWLNASKALQGSFPDSERIPGQAKYEWYGARKAIHLGDWDKAEERLCHSAALDPMGPGAAGLADLFLSRGKLLEADGWGTWAFSLQPKDIKVKQMLADVRSQQGRTEEARALLIESMNVSAGDEQVLKQVAKNYTDLGNKALRARDPYQARRLFWRARVLDGNNALACVGLAKLELKDGDPKRAAKWALEATKLDPNYFHAHLALGDAREKNGEPSLAKQAWLEAARLQPQSPEVRRRLGI